MKDHAVFIQTNHKQIVGALVAEYALRRNSTHNDDFDVHIMHARDYPFFAAREGQLYLRDGRPDVRYRAQDHRRIPRQLRAHRRQVEIREPHLHDVYGSFLDVSWQPTRVFGEREGIKGPADVHLRLNGGHSRDD